MTSISKLPCEGKKCFLFEGYVKHKLIEIQSPNNASCPPPTGSVRTAIVEAVEEYMEFIRNAVENAAPPSGTCKPLCGCAAVGGPRLIDTESDKRLSVTVNDCEYTVILKIFIHGKLWRGKCVKVDIKRPPHIDIPGLHS